MNLNGKSMKLRKLKEYDAPLMLEWMHDRDVVENLHTDFMSKTLEDCICFIKRAQDSDEDLNLAVVDDNDEYMGTVSLKHIRGADAEFAITIRKSAMGKGFSKFAMTEMIRRGMEEMGLRRIYWCVSPKNTRALRFYDKNGYKKVAYKGVALQGYTANEIEYFVWYEISEMDCR